MEMDLIEKPMTSEEKKNLNTLEALIEPNLRAFYLVGAALAKIRNSKLYRDSYNTWDEYCGGRWGMGRAYSYRLIESAEFVESLCSKEKMSPIGDILAENKKFDFSSSNFPIPANEGQIRPLMKLKPEQRVQAWEKAISRAKLDGVPITGKLVQEIVLEILTSKARERLKNRIGQVQEDKKTKKKQLPEEFIDKYQELIELLFGYVTSNWSGLSKKEIREYIEDLWDVVNENEEED